MKANPTTQTIGNFFNNITEQFFVPAYQRRFAWGISQLDALFNDINLLKGGDTHLLGMIVLLVDTHSPGINRLEIVDGQQRITALCVLLKVLQEKFERKDNPGEITEIKKYLACNINDQKEQKMVLGDLDRVDFEKIMLRKNNSNLEIENERIRLALDFFNSKIERLGSGATNFYQKLMNQVEVIRLDIGQAKDAYKLFETINNRGLKLSAADIIKNFLLGHASILGEEILEEVKKEWRQLILNIDKLGYSEIDRFFRQYLMGKIKIKVPKSRLAEEFKNYYYLNIKESRKLSDYRARIELIGRKSHKRQDDIVPEDYNDTEGDDIAKFNPEIYEQKEMGIIQFVKELKECSAIYKSLISAENKNPKISRRLVGIKKIEALPAYTFLINAVRGRIDDKEYIKILDLIECFILRRQVCEYRTGELDDIFPRLCVLSKNKLAESVKKELTDHLPSDEDFKQNFPLFNSKGAEERAKHILSKIEYYLRGDSGEIEIKGGGEVHLEHIIPQTIFSKKDREEHGGDWVKYLGRVKAQKLHKKYIHLIGNLTILAEKLNIKASNNPFKSKKSEYKESTFLLNRDLVNNYEKFKFPQVDKRSERLAKIAVKIWKF